MDRATKTLLEKRLKAAAAKLKVELRRRETCLNIVSDFSCEETDPDGIATTIAKWEGFPDVELWLDRSAGLDRYRFWVGFAAVSRRINSSISSRTFARLLTALPSRLHPKKRVYIRDWIKGEGRSWSYKPGIAKTLDGPYIEEYPKWRMCYLGILDWGGHAKLNTQKLDVHRAAEFITIIVTAAQLGDRYSATVRGGSIGSGNVDDITYRYVRRLERDRQPEFRNNVLRAYERACCLTNCPAPEALEAAHIMLYAKSGDNRITNGILLRADLHRLFDAELLHFRWEEKGKLIALVDPRVKAQSYRKLDGRRVRLPSSQKHWPKIPG